MSLRANLLLFYGLLLAVLLLAVGGFYWAIENTLHDQELLKLSRMQLRDMESFAFNARRHIEEVVDFALLGNTNQQTIATLRQEAETKIQKLIDHVQRELDLIQHAKPDGRESKEWAREREELDILVAAQTIYHGLTATSDRILAHHQEIAKNVLLEQLRDLDDKLDKELAPAIEKFTGGELDEMLTREAVMLSNTRRFERIAIGACLSTFCIVLLCSSFMKRTLEDVTRKEGALAADRAKSEFLANMSHEIRTPMTAILGFTEILTQGVTDPDKIEAAAIVKRNGEHLLDIINDILDLSKIDARQMEINCVPCSPWRIVADTASLMQGRAAAKGITLNVEFQGPIPETILSSPMRLRQILINLLGNAVKFTNQGSVRVVFQMVRNKHGESKLRCDVIDTGIGMSPESLDGLFQPFMQVDTSITRTVEGTGLGLAISKRLAQLLGGDITVESVLGKGSVFSLTVQTGPLDGVKMLENLEEIDITKNAEAKEPQDKPKLEGRILLVEDGPDNQRLISFLLRRAGAEVTLAENGLIALERITQEIEDAKAAGISSSKPLYDVILMDMQMPIMDGYEVTQRLRKMNYTYPIIALTAYAMTTDRQKCIEAGCDDYATKPISEESLLKTLATYMRTPPAPMISG